MNGILWTLGSGAAAVFGVALVVSAWEHLRPAAHRRPLPPAAAPVPAPVIAVDVDLGPPLGDVERRRDILDDALQRMTQPGALAEEHPPAWAETAPMVGPHVGPPQRP